MKTNQFNVVILLLSVLVPSLALSNEANISKEEPDRFYVKLDLGASTFSGYQQSGTTVLSESKVGDLFAFSVGLELSPLLSFELTHNEFGKGEGKLGTPVNGSYETKISSNALSVIPSMPLGDKTSFYLELGEHVWEADSKVGGVSNTSDGSDFFYGFGFNYDVREQIRTGFEFSKYNLDSDDFSTITVSLAYLF